MIKLSLRLKEISEYIDEKDVVLDIGCDHALLDIFLSQKYKKRYYASDLRESALEMAKKNIQKYSAENVILKCGNGLSVLDECEKVDTLVISGMGYYTIIKILSNIKNKKSIKKLVIQSNSNTYEIRKFLLKNDFFIDKEKVVFEKNIYYIISCFKRGKKKYSKKDITVGIFTNDVNKYIEKEIKKNNILLNIIPKKHFIKKYKIKNKNKYLKKFYK